MKMLFTFAPSKQCDRPIKDTEKWAKRVKNECSKNAQTQIKTKNNLGCCRFLTPSLLGQVQILIMSTCSYFETSGIPRHLNQTYHTSHLSMHTNFSHLKQPLYTCSNIIRLLESPFTTSLYVLEVPLLLSLYLGAPCPGPGEAELCNQFQTSLLLAAGIRCTSLTLTITI